MTICRVIIYLSVKKENMDKKVYEKEISVKNNFKNLNIDFLKKFIDENIIEIEKTLDNFIEKANLIIESDSFFIVNSSIKKNYSGNSVDQIHLNYLLNDLKSTSNSLSSLSSFSVIIQQLSFLILFQLFYDFPHMQLIHILAHMSLSNQSPFVYSFH